MGRDADEIYGMPRWAFFQAKVQGETYGFDLRDCAKSYAYRKVLGYQPAVVNPVTKAEWNPRTLARMCERLDRLVDEGHVPQQLSVGWR